MQLNYFDGNIKNPVYMIVGSSCIDDKTTTTKPYSGPTGILFRKLLIKYDFNKCNTSIFYADKENSELIIDQIVLSKPRCILFVGSETIKNIQVLSPNNISRCHGKIYEHLYLRECSSCDIFDDRYNRWIYNMFTYDPFYVYGEKNKELSKVLESQLDNDMRLFKILGSNLSKGIRIENSI